MLRSINQLYDDKLSATDGEIGHVQDFFFDDQNWAIRYVVADTGTWLPGRQVLLTPHSLGRLDQAGKILRVKLTRKQIENSPALDSHKPVSRQYEEEYYRYYGWPYYWQGDALWGIGGFPILEPPARPLPGEPVTAGGLRAERGEAHLRSARAVNGYQLRTGDQTIGHICDFMMDAQSWAIGELVVRTGHRFSGPDLLVPAHQVERISYEESTVFARLAGEAVAQNPPARLSPAGAVA